MPYGFYYGNHFNTRHFAHADKGMNSTSKEKGTDNKPNNTSAYNHEYYMKHKDKWKDNDSSSSSSSSKTAKYLGEGGGEDDFDNSEYVGDTDFYARKRDGKWIIGEEDMRWELPGNLTKDQIEMAMKNIETNILKIPEGAKNRSEIWNEVVNKGMADLASLAGTAEDDDREFDVDAAAMDVIRGKYGNGQARREALGDDYAQVQARVNEIMRSGKLGNKSTSTPASNNQKESNESPSSSSSGKSGDRFSEIISKYYDTRKD